MSTPKALEAHAADTSVVSTTDIDRIWREHGGRQHGPHTETMYIERSKFFDAIRAMMQRSQPAEPEGMELSNFAKEVLPVIDPYLPADIYRIFQTIECHCNVIREDAPAVGDEAQCIRLGIREALALLIDWRARAEKAESALKQPVSDGEAERYAVALELRKPMCEPNEVPEEPEFLQECADLLRRQARQIKDMRGLLSEADALLYQPNNDFKAKDALARRMRAALSADQAGAK
jgi:hypothetical protein